MVLGAVAAVKETALAQTPVPQAPAELPRLEARDRRQRAETLDDDAAFQFLPPHRNRSESGYPHAFFMLSMRSSSAVLQILIKVGDLPLASARRRQLGRKIVGPIRVAGGHWKQLGVAKFSGAT